MRAAKALSLLMPLAAVYALFTAPAVASDGKSKQNAFRLGQIEISIPPGFSAPVRRAPNERAEIYLFIEQPGSGRAPTMLQVMRFKVPEAASDLSEQTLYSASFDFLNGLMGTFATSVTQWSRSPNKKVRLAGHPAACAIWTGSLNGFPSTGTMYFVALGKETFVLHTYGSRAEPNPSLNASIRAIDGLIVRAGGNMASGHEAKQ
jgi:hypothetical protein